MLALSVRQPWAWLIVNGHKTVENRVWATNYRGPILIHASKTPGLGPNDLTGLRRELHRQCGIAIPADLPTGGIVGTVNLVDCVTECVDLVDASWHEPGQYAFILRNARPLPFQPMSGRLKFFDTHYIPR